MGPYRYGWHPPTTPRNRARLFAPRHASLSALPPHVDWAQSYPGRWPAVYNQLQTNSCVGQGLKRLVHTLQIEQNAPRVIEPSAMFIYHNAREFEGATGQDCGANVCDGFLGLVIDGFCSEDDWPFDPACITRTPTQHCFDHAQANCIEDYEPAQLDGSDLQAILEALTHRPITGGVVCFESFQSPEVLRTGDVVMPGQDESADGGHCIFIRGYDLPREVLLFDNSWGPSYGRRGTGTIPFEYARRWLSDCWLALKTTEAA